MPSLPQHLGANRFLLPSFLPSVVRSTLNRPARQRQWTLAAAAERTPLVRRPKVFSARSGGGGGGEGDLGRDQVLNTGDVNPDSRFK